MSNLKKQWETAKKQGKREDFIKKLLGSVRNVYSVKQKFTDKGSQGILKILNDYVANYKKPKSSDKSYSEKLLDFLKNSPKGQSLVLPDWYTEAELLSLIGSYAIQFDHFNILRIISLYVPLDEKKLVRSKHELIVKNALTSAESKEKKPLHMYESIIKSAIGAPHERLVYETLKANINLKHRDDRPKLFEIIRKAIIVKSSIFELLINNYKDIILTEYYFHTELMNYSIFYSNAVSLKIIFDNFSHKYLGNINDGINGCKLTKEVMDVLITFCQNNNDIGIVEHLIDHNIDTYVDVIDQSTKSQFRGYYSDGNKYYKSSYLNEKIYYGDSDVEISDIYENILYLLTLSNDVILHENTLCRLFTCIISERDFQKFQQLLTLTNPSVDLIKELTIYLLTVKTKCIYLDSNMGCFDCDDEDHEGWYSRVYPDSCNNNHYKWNSDESFEFLWDTLSLLITIGKDDIQCIIQEHLPIVINFYIDDQERISTLLSIIRVDPKIASNTFRKLVKTRTHYGVGVNDMILATIKYYNPHVFNVKLTCNVFFDQIYFMEEMLKKTNNQLQGLYLWSDRHNFLKISWIKIGLVAKLPQDVITTIFKLMNH
jgi:hypothetical protein